MTPTTTSPPRGARPAGPTGPTGTAISARGLRKSYGEQLVLDGIDLDVAAGTIFALLGPNGAGKTTMVQILSTLVAPDAGSIRVDGHDLAAAEAIRRSIGVTGQFSAVDELLSGRENLVLMSDLHHLGRTEGRRRVDELLGQFDLTEHAAKPASTYSGGMKRKLDLAMTLVGRPRIIFLDEPTAGLDPRSRRTMWDAIRDLVDLQGVTIFLTTQYLDEADHLAHRIAVLDHGHLVAEGTAAELKRRMPGGYIRLRFDKAEQLAAAAAAFPGSVRDDADLTLQVPGDADVSSLRALLDRLDERSIAVGELSLHTPDLDDVFLALTDRPSPTGSGAPSSATPTERNVR